MTWEKDQAKSSADAYYESIQEDWQQLAGRVITPDDYRVMQALRLGGIPLDVVQSTLREQVPRRRGKTLAYHRPAIVDAWKTQQRLAAPAADWEGYEADAPKGWEVERDELAGKVKALIDLAQDDGDLSPTAGGRMFGAAVELLDGLQEEEDLWPAWRSWKREAAEVAAQEGIEPGVVEEIIRRTEA